MARASTKPIVREQTPYVYLELTWNEMETLLAVVGNITGNPERTRRRDTDKIYDALLPIIGEWRRGIKGMPVRGSTIHFSEEIYRESTD